MVINSFFDHIFQLLNTVTNLGGTWPSTVALWLLDPLTSKACSGTAMSNDCSNTTLEEVNCGFLEKKKSITQCYMLNSNWCNFIAVLQGCRWGMLDVGWWILRWDNRMCNNWFCVAGVGKTDNPSTTSSPTKGMESRQSKRSKKRLTRQDLGKLQGYNLWNAQVPSVI